MAPLPISNVQPEAPAGMVLRRLPSTWPLVRETLVAQFGTAISVLPPVITLPVVKVVVAFTETVLPIVTPFALLMVRLLSPVPAAIGVSALPERFCAAPPFMVTVPVPRLKMPFTVEVAPRRNSWPAPLFVKVPLLEKLPLRVWLRLVPPLNVLPEPIERSPLIVRAAAGVALLVPEVDRLL